MNDLKMAYKENWGTKIWRTDDGLCEVSCIAFPCFPDPDIPRRVSVIFQPLIILSPPDYRPTSFRAFSVAQFHQIWGLYNLQAPRCATSIKRSAERGRDSYGRSFVFRFGGLTPLLPSLPSPPLALELGPSPPFSPLPFPPVLPPLLP